MKDDDFLYVKDYMKFEDRESMTLQFRHLLAKVTVNLMESESEYLTNAKDVSVALTNCLYEGNFDFDEERNMRIGEALMTDDNTANITLASSTTRQAGRSPPTKDSSFRKAWNRTRSSTSKSPWTVQYTAGGCSCLATRLL